MRADYLSYKRATNVAILGVVFQSVATAALLIYGSAGNDPAAFTAGLFAAIGILAWIVLGIVYDQHRRERIEAIESENFAADNLVGSSVFEGEADNLNVAARRLETMQRVLVPVVSLVIGAALVGLGISRFFGGTEAAIPDGFAAPPQGAWAIAIGLALAALGFVFARFVSGMAKTREWSMLNGGAAFAVGTSLAGVVLTIAHTAEQVGSDNPLRLLYVALPIAMVILGGEVFLNFLLDLYRPRKQGEAVRPAFDSRLLGFVAAPDQIAESISDAINYQLGFDVTSSWFYRLLSRWVFGIGLLGLLVLWGLTSLRVVEPHQRALHLRFGEPIAELSPGLHLTAPWPIDEVIVPDYIRTEVVGEGLAETILERTAMGKRELQLGSSPRPDDADAPTLWSSANTRPGLKQFIVQPDLSLIEDDRAGIGSGLSLVSIELPLYYSVREGELQNYLTLGPDAATRDRILEAIAERETIRYLGSLQVSEVLGPRRNEIAQELEQRIGRAFAALNPDPETGEPAGAGVEIWFVTIEGATPPPNAVTAFESVIEARAKSSTQLAKAQQAAAEDLTRVIGGVEEADKVAGLISWREELSQTLGPDAAEVRLADVEIREAIEASGGEAAQLLLQAKADRWTRHMNERSRASIYQGQLTAFTQAETIFKTKRYFEALAVAFEDTRLYITGAAPEQLRVRFDLMDEFFASEVFDPQLAGE